MEGFEGPAAVGSFIIGRQALPNASSPEEVGQAFTEIFYREILKQTLSSQMMGSEDSGISFSNNLTKEFFIAKMAKELASQDRGAINRLVADEIKEKEKR